MIKDLSVQSILRSTHGKYVDDLTISEVVTVGVTSPLQSDLDVISQWSSQNIVNLNLKKCKEMTICALLTRPDPPPLLSNNLPLEKVPSFKVLKGLTLCNTLKWSDNINEIVAKASKRLYNLRVLKWACIPSCGLLCVYVGLICDIDCVKWSNSLTVYLSDKIERVQKRALRILFPNSRYNDALSVCKITRIDYRHFDLCFRVWHNVRDQGSI